MTLDNIVQTIQRAAEEGKSELHRFRSWELCYSHFGKFETQEDALHLSAFLASWGMMRASSFLLQYNYRVHDGAARSCREFEHLRGISMEEALEKQDEIFDLLRRVREEYASQPIGKGATDTLLTKVALGTMACTPAYDRFFVIGLRECKLSHSYLNPKNHAAMLRCCMKHKHQFALAREAVAELWPDMPDMRLVDTYFWQLGREAESNSQRPMAQ